MLKSKMGPLAGLVILLTVAGFLSTGEHTMAPSAAHASSVPSGFVHRDGKNLRLDGEPYRFVGFNAFGMTGCATGTAWRQSELDAYFGGLPPAAMTRTWAFASYGVDELDLIVARAEAYGQKLILSLANQGADCGESAKDLAFYQSGYQGAYLSWVRTVVSRYKDSPAIGMWELINEPGHQTTVDSATMKAFFDAAAAVIKGIDPYHLVGTGSMAEYTPGTKDFEFVHSGPDIDVGSLHEYDQDHNDQVVSRHLAPTLTPLYRLNKPFIVGETGIIAGPGCAISTQQRSEMFRRELDGYFLSGVAGVLIWTYSPNPRPADPSSACMHQVRAPDPDPTIAMVRSYTPPTPVQAPASNRLLEARNSAKCLNVPGSSGANGVLIQQTTCAQTTNQRFAFRPTSDGFYQIVAQHSVKCFDVQGQSLALKAPVQQWDCISLAPNQQVRLEATDSGHHRLILRHSLQCLSISGASSANGAQLVQYDCKPGSANQQFTIR